MTYNNAMKYIQAAGRTAGRPTLERMRLLCRYLGDPQRRLKFIHIAGTNGKGSVTTMLSAILTAAGYRCGRYISPYVLEFRERICVDGDMIPHDVLADCTAQVAAAVRRMQADIALAREGGTPSMPIPAVMLSSDIADTPVQFEIITAIAFLYFKRQFCDVVVLECGLGGRYDATNVIDQPLCAVLTAIGMDHTDLLGDTLEQIAAEKCGIIKRGTAEVISCPQLPAAQRTITDACAAANCRLTQPNRADLLITRTTLRGLHMSYRGQPYTLSLCAQYQAINAATVLETVGALRRLGMNLPEATVQSALEQVRFPARFEVLSIAPMIVVDGAHNRPGMEALCASLQPLRSRIGGQMRLMIGMLRDKNPAKVLEALAVLRAGEDPFPLARIDVLTPDTPRAMPAEELAELLRSMPWLQGVEICVPTSVDAAARDAISALSEKDALICIGSLYLAADLRRKLRDELNR
ncbi:MAG: bifunctional folylpolyglutamate synthase/dihydrofolate synthase [Clostridia bacterium]|nr:bifunctional folylpolyglutamate synthase/dihydrofolate synthase [Clostridia bacterium]